MNDVAERNLTEYLKQVIAMESNVYRQEKSVAQAKKSLVRKEPQKPNLNKPKAPEQLSTFDEELKKNYHNDLKKVKTNRKLYLGGTILFFVTSFGCMIFLLSEILILPLVILFLICGIWFAKEASKLSKVEKNMPLEYQEKQKEFEEQRKKENKEKEIEYKRELEEYEKAMKLGMEDYNKNLAVVQNKYQIAENVIAEMENTLEQSKNVLNELYALDYIFPKYRNFVAVCSFYEYFMSGRCVELAGANGAYNLFEAELRQNLIIAKLDTIISQLDRIQQNQYTLYMEIKDTNQILKDISSDVKEILDTTKQIETYSHITALSSYATAKNTEAIKYISLMNG